MIMDNKKITPIVFSSNRQVKPGIDLLINYNCSAEYTLLVNSVINAISSIRFMQFFQCTVFAISNPVLLIL